ncbi:MAG TPA: hypothetical protein VNT04_01340 [Gaiellaceae bacterium]|nr:hypothetical protein [Gaiellaceae bacterium]
MELAALLQSLEDVGAETDLRPAVALLAGRELVIAPEELNAARRRAVLLLAAGGDPHRGLELDGRAVTALAEELSGHNREVEVRRGLEELRYEASPYPHVLAAVRALLTNRTLAWRAYACALLAEELED